MKRRTATSTIVSMAGEPWEKLATLATRNGIPVRSIYRFVKDGLRVARPAGGRSIYTKQSWLDTYLESKVSK